jgi:hypothetical protein
MNPLGSLNVIAAMAMLILAGEALAASNCADAARALVAGSRAEVAAEPRHRAGAAHDIAWSTSEGHEGLCRFDEQGRLNLVEITKFPAAPARPYAVHCGSVNFRRNDCSLQGLAEDVGLERQFSRAQCVRGRTWGFYGRTLWVDKGCNGRFMVTPNAAWEAYTVSCESVRNRRTECPIKGPSAVALQRKLSQASCVEGQSWGYRDELMWVDRGCRGEFSVRPAGSGDSGYVDVRGRAGDSCMAMARTHGFEVTDYSIIDWDRQHAEVELLAYRRGINLSLICRYDVASDQARLYGQ